MSTFKEAIKSLFEKHPSKKAELKVLLSEEDNAVKFAMAALADGSNLYTPSETWGKDAPVFTDEAGTSVAPDGTYETADGTQIVVAGGIVTDMIEKVEEAALTEEQSVAVVEELGKALTELEETKTALETQKTELAAEKEKVVKMSKDIADLKKQMVALSKLPGAESVKFAKETTEDKPLSTRDRIVKAMKDAAN